jgi:hypothetical protein
MIDFSPITKKKYNNYVWLLMENLKSDLANEESKKKSEKSKFSLGKSKKINKLAKLKKIGQSK